MNLSRLLFTAFFGATLLLVGHARAAIDDPPPSTRTESPPDSLFAPRGGTDLTLASGLPFLGIAELAYGVSDRFSIGAFGAATPDLGDIRGTVALGLRPRGVVVESGAWRSVVVVPVLFYPQIKGFGDREPWMLTRPTLSIERTLPAGVRVSLGMGLIAAACTDSIFTLGKEHTMMGGLWNTASAGVSIPVSARTSVFAEGSLVLHGVALASQDWIGGAPVVAYAGIVTSL